MPQGSYTVYGPLAAGKLSLNVPDAVASAVFVPVKKYAPSSVMSSPGSTSCTVTAMSVPVERSHTAVTLAPGNTSACALPLPSATTSVALASTSMNTTCSCGSWHKATDAFVIVTFTVPLTNGTSASGASLVIAPSSSPASAPWCDEPHATSATSASALT